MSTITAPITAPPRRESESLVGRTLAGRFTIGEYIAGGSFGSFHLGVEKPSGRQVAIKFEKKDLPTPQLGLEFGFYRNLGSIRFIPKILSLAPIDGWNALVMELLGPSLGKMNDLCGQSFSIQTTTQLMIQLITIFEYVHEHGIIYRDIKPENFLIGQPRTDKWCTVCLIDLGFCKKYIDEENRHIIFRTGKPITGTTRYISANNHGGRELSRRDDLEALLYMMVFLHKGALPWQGIVCEERERLKQILIMKLHTPPAELCSAMPPEYAQFGCHVKKLDFDERPHYRKMSALFRNVLTRLGTAMEDKIYDWDENHDIKKPSEVQPSSTAVAVSRETSSEATTLLPSQ